MKRYIEQNEIMALFFRSYFLYTGLAIDKKKTEEKSAQIYAYKTLMRVLAYYSTLPKVRSQELLKKLSMFVEEPDTPYQRIFGEVIDETLTFIHEQVLFTTKEEHSLHERYA